MHSRERVWRELHPVPQTRITPAGAPALSAVSLTGVIYVTSFRAAIDDEWSWDRGSVERWHATSIGSTDTVKNANPPPKNPGTASPKLVKEFSEAVDRSTTSNDRAQHSQDASKSHPIILARRPPIPAHTPPQTLTCASPTPQQKDRAFVDPALRDVASGKRELAKNAKGPAVGKMSIGSQI
jgi:hypothetical protein